MTVQDGPGPVDSGTTFTRRDGSVVTSRPGPGGSRIIEPSGKPSRGGGGSSAPAHGSASNPVFFRYAPPQVTAAQAAKARLTTPTRLGTPVALLMLAGLALVWYALHSWDQKYGTFNGHFAGSAFASAPSPAAPAAAASPAAPSKSVAS